MTAHPPASTLLMPGAAALSLFLSIGCSSSARHADDPRGTNISEVAPVQRLSIPTAPPPSGTSARVGGDPAATVTGSDADYRAGSCRIDTPLPIGYPLPTPPGSIDLKTYPSVRLAEVASAGDPDSGMNKTFWPLFNHIKRHDIPMTSPVEMNFRGMRDSDKPSPESWSMAFLYRQPDLNPTGVEGKVIVRDAQPVTVVAVGLKGNYSMSLVHRGMRQIEDWLAANPRWQPAGDWRTLYYNGPALFWWNKWAEVQIPVCPMPDSQPAQSGTPGPGPSQ